MLNKAVVALIRKNFNVSDDVEIKVVCTASVTHYDPQVLRVISCPPSDDFNGVCKLPDQQTLYEFEATWWVDEKRHKVRCMLPNLDVHVEDYAPI